MNSGVKEIAIPVSAAIVSCLALLFLRSLSLKIFKAWANRKENNLRVYGAVWQSISIPSVYWCIAVALYVGMAISDLPDKYVLYLEKAIHVILVFSVSIAVSDIIGRIFSSQVQKLNIPISTTGIVNGVLRGTIVIIGLLIILSILGISIAPLITALGVGGLAVALALQDTLANLFAGFHILLEKSIRIGDFIKVETGQEGCVDDITWRTTRIRTLSSSMVMVPNRKLAQSVVINYSLPEKEVGVGVVIRVSYAADYERVEKILTEEARKAVTEVPGVVETQQPSVSFTPGESSLDFTLGFTVKQFSDQYSVQNEVRKRIFKRFREEGLDFPFATRTVYMKETHDGRTDTTV